MHGGAHAGHQLAAQAIKAGMCCNLDKPAFDFGEEGQSTRTVIECDIVGNLLEIALRWPRNPEIHPALFRIAGAKPCEHGAAGLAWAAIDGFLQQGAQFLQFLMLR